MRKLQSWHLGFWVAWGLTLSLMTTAVAQAADVTLEVKNAYQRLQRDNPGTWAVGWNKVYRQVESLTGQSVYLASNPDTAATLFLQNNSELFELQPGIGDLKVSRRNQSLSGTHITYEQTWNGLPVFNGGIDVHVSQGGQVFLVNSSYAKPSALEALPPGRLSSDNAIQAAVAAHAASVTADKTGREIAAGAARVTDAPVRGVYRGEHGLAMAYRLTVSGTVYVVNAETGAILEEAPLAQYVNGTGVVFDPNPVNSLNNVTLRDLNDTNYPALGPAYFTRTLNAITQLANPVRFTLQGPYVKMFDATQEFLDGACGTSASTIVGKAPPVQVNSNFTYFRNQSSFEHTNVYFHIDKNQRYVRSLGFLTLLNTGIRADAHAFTADNSYFCSSPGGVYLAFGDGGVDDAEDADVVLHEYGHALQQTASGRRYSTAGHPMAMGEGFGDYWAYSAKTTGFNPDCFAEWDANNGGCMRRLNTNKKFPADYVGQPHADGEIWSRGLRDLLRKIGKQKADKIILDSHFLIPVSPTFSKGVQALIDADQRLYAGANKDHICSVMTDRGISAPGCGYWLKLNWSRLGTDVDLHFRPPAGVNYVGWNYAGDCAYYNSNPNWGTVADLEDNPLLYGDCVSTCVFEQITVDKLTTPGTYKVLVHFYNNRGVATSTAAKVEVFRGASKIHTSSRMVTNPGSGPSTGDVWVPFSIVVNPPAAVSFEIIDKVEKGGFSPGPAKRGE